MNNGRSWVMERLAAFADKRAFVADGRAYLFSDVVASTTAWLERLTSLLVERAVVIVNGDHSHDAVGAILALYLRGCIVVPLHLTSLEKVDEVIALTGANWVINAGPQSDLSRTASRQEPHPLIAQLHASGEPGLVLLSSGSTGCPKAMLLNLDRLLQRYEQPGRYSPYVTAAFLLFDHIGGFNTLMHCLFTGGTLVKLPSRAPVEVCSCIAEHGIELLPTTPTFLNMLLISRAYADFDVSSLKLITYGTEVMPESTLQALRQAFPGVTLKQTYGSSELGILATKSKSNDSVWMKIGGDQTDVKVVDGVLWIKSRTAMLGYLNAESPIDEQGWFCTGDLVEVDGDYVRVLGRKETLINVGGLKVFPAEVENCILTAPYVKDVVVWGKKNAVTGFIVAASICKVEDVDPREAKTRILEHCRASLDEFKVPKYIEFLDTALYNERFKKAKVSGVE